MKIGGFSKHQNKTIDNARYNGRFLTACISQVNASTMSRNFVQRSEKQLAKCPKVHVFICVHVVLVFLLYSFCIYLFGMISQFLFLFIYTGCKQVQETVWKNISIFVICQIFFRKFHWPTVLFSLFQMSPT